MFTRLFTFLMCVWLFQACNSPALPPDQYMAWLQDPEHGFVTSKTVGDYTFSFQYKPYDYMALLKLKTSTPDLQQLQEVKTTYGTMQYFTLRLAAADQQELMKAQGADNLDYFQRLEYFSGQMQERISLIDGKDTLPCLLYHFERNYGLAPYSDVLLGFAASEYSEKEPADKTLFYNDDQLGTGPIFLTLSGDALSREPQLQLAR